MIRAQNKWKQGDVELALIDPAQLNANKMSDQDFDRLKENIKISGLSTAVTLYRRSEDGRFVIIGGHHRVKACIDLGYDKIPAIWADEKDLSRDEVIAIQLSHNSLHGEDDKGILKRLFDEIQSLDFKDFANVNIDEIESVSIESTPIIPISEHFSVALTLYSDDIKCLQELMEITDEDLNRNDLVILADQKDTEDKYLELVTEIDKVYDIKSPSISFAKILELAKAKLESDRGGQ